MTCSPWKRWKTIHQGSNREEKKSKDWSGCIWTSGAPTCLQHCTGPRK